ncbi:hypothetical protein M0804_005104 [Polistes exclamans]|nr:hypothetical protein M0804_005104 [Polistes exclamans]
MNRPSAFPSHARFNPTSLALNAKWSLRRELGIEGVSSIAPPDSTGRTSINFTPDSIRPPSWNFGSG